MTVQRLYGASEIARDLGVTRAAISNMISRHGDKLPEPCAFVVDERVGRRWLWDDAGLAAWREFHRPTTIKIPPSAAPQAWHEAAEQTTTIGRRS